eukprot:SAG11_NODE_2189_length_3707_cov_2.141075_3_plen_233_part_00
MYGTQDHEVPSADDLLEGVLTSEAESRKQAGVLKLKLALDSADSEIDVIQALGYIRADIWDDWMGEVIIDMAARGNISSDVIASVEELQYLQTHLFASKEEDILGQALDFTYRPEDGDAESSEDELELEEGMDLLSITRLKWRAETLAEHEAEERFILTMMFTVLIGYGCVANLIGSHLLGAFIAGMSFCWMDSALKLWHAQVKRIANWLIRLFFGACVISLLHRCTNITRL